jgi:hypothetical protein
MLLPTSAKLAFLAVNGYLPRADLSKATTVLARQDGDDQYAILLVVGTTIIAEGWVVPRRMALDGLYAVVAAEVEQVMSKMLTAGERWVGDGRVSECKG